jgi:hypothetical protein
MNKYGLEGPLHEPSTLAAIGKINLTDNYFDVDVSLRYCCPLDQLKKIILIVSDYTVCRHNGYRHSTSKFPHGL